MAMSGLGVGDEHTIVLVDEGRYGHADVHVLEGGFARWIGEGRAVSREIIRHSPASYTVKVPS
jgi:3-mercaptopyruvate sulfurtransferase SseA